VSHVLLFCADRAIRFVYQDQLIRQHMLATRMKRAIGLPAWGLSSTLGTVPFSDVPGAVLECRSLMLRGPAQRNGQL
jgi:hypothetical protein